MLAKIDLICIAFLVCPLEIAAYEHGQQERADTAMIGLVELSALEEAFDYEEEGSHLGELLHELAD